MRIYVAGASTELARAVSVMRGLEAVGHEITHDWTESVEVAGACSQTTLRQCALADYAGVLTADALVLISPRTSSMGAWVEMGMALATGKRVIVVGTNGCIFTHMPGVEVVDNCSDLIKRLS